VGQGETQVGSVEPGDHAAHDAPGPDPHLAANRFLTGPNVFTLLRLCCIPLFLYILFGHHSRAGAAWLLGGLGATDWVDGWMARKFDQVSEFGKIFDPTADRLLFIVTAIAILADGAAPRWFVAMVLAREVLFGGTVAICTVVFHMQRFDVTWWGKLATFLLMFAIPGFMLGHSDFTGHTGFEVASWILGIPGLAISYWTAVTYIPTIRASLRAGRATAAANGAP
jgi:cardiolipin synthase (CMP-forming)